MPDFRCHRCRQLLRGVPGAEASCPACGSVFTLGAEHLARFQLPPAVNVSLRWSDGRPWTGRQPLFVRRGGLELPPVPLNRNGAATITEEMFHKAARDDAEANMMSQRDYDLARYIEVTVLSRSEGRKRANARRASGWPASAFEVELWGSLDCMLDAYAPSDAQEVRSVIAVIDLESPVTNLELLLHPTVEAG